MRKYYLASGTDREVVDLTDYSTIIIEAVHEYLPDATVRVEERYYTVDPTPQPGIAVKIGRKICQSGLREYCVQIPKLFTSIKIKDKKEEGDGSTDGTTEQKRPGGHH